ncbi:hypothetical protein POJ06DRAFT_245777 [Lipomyces tetrasporus]|uniref:GDT1 family protein n=1 Tax=Lipomyces tetrasporus TaxID=54092 RepID=A0AAD7QWM0_9ASCO|nr:uncharacterized protein POJ06DRAFT_245777 [Lipomyces tetrasporus]KAJ8102838.1 hypothetical protein POJ06DRAFT_245777 [Lipomyces tetrasporus]
MMRFPILSAVAIVALLLVLLAPASAAGSLVRRAEEVVATERMPSVEGSEGSPLARTELSTDDRAMGELVSSEDLPASGSSEDMERAPTVAQALGTLPDPIVENYRSFAMAFMMIIFSEIGDKTFLIAAIMAMKHPRTTVFTGAFASLAVMTVLSALLGHAVPQLIPKKYTSFLAAVLFVVFGVKLINEGLHMDKNAGVEEEMQEVETELEAKDFESQSGSLESGSVKAVKKGKLDGLWNLFSLFLSPVWIQTFVMTFLGEWGDRSQIATIAMAAGQDYLFVIIGAIAGHGLCTLAAVLGGKFLASKISLRTITLGGGAAFLVFAIIYFYEAIHL